MNRPPMLQHWLVARPIRFAFAPAIFFLNVQAAYWETWHAVWRPTK